MSSLNTSYNKDVLKQKVESIKRGMLETVTPFCTENFYVIYYGAYDIDPKCLVYWVCVKTDQEKESLNNSIVLKNALRQLLESYEYPIEAQRFVHIGFESQENVDRESNGNWWHHFK